MANEDRTFQDLKALCQEARAKLDHKVSFRLRVLLDMLLLELSNEERAGLSSGQTQPPVIEG